MGILKVIIADYDVIVRKKLRRILEGNNFNVVGESQNGLQAYDRYIEHKPDIVILSVAMPVYDGISALKKIINHDEDSCVIMLSDKGQNKEIFKALECGAKHFIEKPFEKENIIKVINDVMNIERME